ncbi:MAG: hypothetical protein RLZZ28_301 [Bacteroidota bacterium]|jgi:hypothetical protein
MVKYSTTIKQFGELGEKTGWTYVEVPADIAVQLKPGNRKSFRVKGKLDQYAISGVAILPMGGGSFILPLNAAMRKGIHKKKGGMLALQLSVDDNPLQPPDGFMECLDDEPKAKAFYHQLKPSHRNYFIKWMGGVKSDQARAKRMATVITALSYEQDFVEMFRALKAAKPK